MHTVSELTHKAIGNYAEMVGEHYEIHGPDGQADLHGLVKKLGGSIAYSDSEESLHVRGKGDFTIYLSEYTSARRDRFTLAHELGHYYLHYLHPKQTEEASFGRGARNLGETQANVFAASLLMPEANFKRAFRRYSGDIWVLAEKFGVSPRAAEVRSQVLGLVAK